MKTMFGLIVATGLIWLANALGLWLFTILFGALLAFYESRAGRSIWMSLLAGILGWGLPLWVLSSSSDVVALAQLLGKIIGLGSHGTLAVLVLPAVVGGLFAASGAWVVSAVRGVRRRPDVQQEQTVQL